jgi:hypothetical protein
MRTNNRRTGNVDPPRGQCGTCIRAQNWRGSGLQVCDDRHGGQRRAVYAQYVDAVYPAEHVRSLLILLFLALVLLMQSFSLLLFRLLLFLLSLFVRFRAILFFVLLLLRRFIFFFLFLSLPGRDRSACKQTQNRGADNQLHRGLQ